MSIFPSSPLSWRLTTDMLKSGELGVYLDNALAGALCNIERPVKLVMLVNIVELVKFLEKSEKVKSQRLQWSEAQIGMMY